MPAVSRQSRTIDHFAEFQGRLSGAGARDALAYLLSLTDYRFIGVFRFQDGRANAAIHYDLVPRDAAQIDLELQIQIQAASALAYSGQVPPYPLPGP
jgi:hypothetical protein